MAQPLNIDTILIEKTEFDLSKLDLDYNKDGDLSLVFPDGNIKPLSPEGFETLCQVISVPYSFAKKIHQSGRSHVLAYLQKQLAQAWVKDPVVTVVNNGQVVSVAHPSKLFMQRDEMLQLDAEIRKAAGDKLSRVEVDRNKFTVTYYIDYFSDVLEEDPEKSSYTLRCMIEYSLVGWEHPSVYYGAVREVDTTMLYLPIKPTYFPVSALLVGDIISTISTLDASGWTDLRYAVVKIANTSASLQEVKEARAKLLKLKADKADGETETRINDLLRWSQIVKDYELKGKKPKPSRKWYMSAAAPYTLFHVHNVLTREATFAPADTNTEVVDKLFSLDQKFLKKLPDMAEHNPPKVYTSAE